MGLGGSVGFVGRAFGGIAARNGAVLTGESISSVASRPEAVSGAIAGDIADRSLQNFMPQLSNYSLAGDADHRRPYPHHRHRHGIPRGRGARGFLRS